MASASWTRSQVKSEPKAGSSVMPVGGWRQVPAHSLSDRLQEQTSAIGPVG